MISVIRAQDLNTERFIAENVSEVTAAAGDGTAINALSGGADQFAARDSQPADQRASATMKVDPPINIISACPAAALAAATASGTEG